MNKTTSKNFVIKSYRTGNRLANTKQTAYKVIYINNDGKESGAFYGFFTKAEAKAFVSKMVKKANNQE